MTESTYHVRATKTDPNVFHVIELTPDGAFSVFTGTEQQCRYQQARRTNLDAAQRAARARKLGGISKPQRIH